jgi:hypothetical protein
MTHEEKHFSILMEYYKNNNLNVISTNKVLTLCNYKKNGTTIIPITQLCSLVVNFKTQNENDVKEDHWCRTFHHVHQLDNNSYSIINSFSHTKENIELKYI